MTGERAGAPQVFAQRMPTQSEARARAEFGGVVDWIPAVAPHSPLFDGSELKLRERPPIVADCEREPAGEGRAVVDGVELAQSASPRGQDAENSQAP